MLLRFTDDTFEEHMASTIGVDFKVRTIDVRGECSAPSPSLPYGRAAARTQLAPHRLERFVRVRARTLCA
jgi:hypothetical protein